jgi:hypothetical protein
MKGHTITRALGALGLATVAVAVSLAQPTQLAFWNFNESNPLDSTAMLAADGGVFASQAQISINLASIRVSTTTARASAARRWIRTTRPTLPAQLGAADH